MERLRKRRERGGERERYIIHREGVGKRGRDKDEREG